jgi:predicted branched-subunit amino acid permease
VVRDGVSVGLATGAYGLSFGALSAAAGLTLAQTCALSLLMFTGGSQFALVGVVAGGGNALGGAATAVLLGARNAFYGLRLASLLQLRGLRRLLAAQLVIDESSAMAIGREDDPHAARVAFWATGVSVFVFWNLATLLGALGAEALSDPAVLGLDAAAPAAFLALLAPNVRRRRPLAVALAAAVVAVAVTPFVPAGVPILAAAAVAVATALTGPRPPDEDEPAPGGAPAHGDAPAVEQPPAATHAPSARDTPADDPPAATDERPAGPGGDAPMTGHDDGWRRARASEGRGH